ncbi:MAG TPA: FAD/NAD(P)-binding oxidoreductase [Myxococcales bacterium]|nr:FAD/NAD(P)-binding oxidoreductase [Myxococcales bacterium]
MPDNYDVAIIGGGVIGCSIARELSRFRLKTVLLEKNAEVGFGTSKTNSGIIHSGHDTPLSTLKGRLVVRGNALFDGLHEELGFGFRRIGELNVAQTEEELEGLKALKALGDEKGVPGIELWDQERLRREEPNLSRALLGALYCPSAGVINPYEFAFALIENAVANGVELRVDSPVLGLEPNAEGLAVRTPGGTLQARFVLNCAGVAADEVAAMVGCADFKILPRKGEEYMLDKRLKGLVRRLVFPLPTKTTKGILIIPTFDGTIMVGPTAQTIEDRGDFATTAQGADEVFGYIKRLCPAIDARDAITAFAGLRAVSDTNDFVIGPTKVKGFVNVAGTQSPGLTSSPAIAEHVLEILSLQGLELSRKARFNSRVAPPPRFAQLGHAEQDELANKDPLFAKVVCRCELVTEAEIHDAVDHGARTLDGIKFRSRAGMGRCQGGFCSSRCMEILSKRLAKPIYDITKRGGGSYIAVPIDLEAARGEPPLHPDARPRINAEEK